MCSSGCGSALRTKAEAVPGVILPGRHAFLRKQRDLQDLGSTQDFLLTDGGDGFPRDSVDLVEGMGTKVAVVRGADEQQQADGMLLVST